MGERVFPLPEDVGIRRARPSVHLIRSAVAHLRAHIDRVSPEKAAKALWGDDPATDALVRRSTQDEHRETSQAPNQMHARERNRHTDP